MLVRVLKRFPYNATGAGGAVMLLEGAVISIRDNLVPGLRAEGFVTPAAAGEPIREIIQAVEIAPPKPVPEKHPNDDVPIPANWGELSWPERRSLAARVNFEGRAVVTAGDVNGVIIAELDRRATANAAA